MQDGAGVHRQQRNGATQQHRKQVQRYRSQNNLVLPDVIETCEHSSGADLLVRPRRSTQLDARESPSGQSTGNDTGGVDSGWSAKEGIKNSAQRGSDNGGSLKNRCIPGDSVRENVRRDQQ